MTQSELIKAIHSKGKIVAINHMNNYKFYQLDNDIYYATFDSVINEGDYNDFVNKINNGLYNKNVKLV